jgi:hypothetical protein
MLVRDEVEATLPAQQAGAAEHNWPLRWFVACFVVLLLSSDSFLSYWEYSWKLYFDPAG